MVERITAYRSIDGRIFATRWDATQYETQKELVKFLLDNGCNEAQANKLAGVAGDLAMLLDPLGKEIRKDLKAREG